MVDSHKYPEMYINEYSFGKGHLNLAGTQLYNVFKQRN